MLAEHQRDAVHLALKLEEIPQSQILGLEPRQIPDVMLACPCQVNVVVCRDPRARVRPRFERDRDARGLTPGQLELDPRRFVEKSAIGVDAILAGRKIELPCALEQ